MKEPKRAFLLTPPAAPLPAGMAFLRQVRFRLREDYRVKISRALEVLNEEEVWWRPNEASNSIGNLLLHLAGNVRQWAVAGIGGAPDLRDRPREFSERSQLNQAELLAQLDAALDEAEAVIARIEEELAASQSDAALQRERLIQGFPQTVQDALFHIVEHFSYHTGQIIYIAKFHEGERVQYYDDRQLDRAK
jgi:uncharacterized damage-inducible protein DinB